MPLKWIGAILVIAGCGGCGFSMAMDYRREEKCLRELLKALEFMECELACRMPALSQICRETADQSSGCVQRIFRLLAAELDMQVCPDAGCCVEAVLNNAGRLSGSVVNILRQLGQSLGCFDIDGQLSAIASVKAACGQLLQEHLSHRDVRLRSYQTLGLCVGAALAILLI